MSNNRTRKNREKYILTATIYCDKVFNNNDINTRCSATGCFAMKVHSYSEKGIRYEAKINDPVVKSVSAVDNGS